MYNTYAPGVDCRETFQVVVSLMEPPDSTALISAPCVAMGRNSWVAVESLARQVVSEVLTVWAEEGRKKFRRSRSEGLRDAF